MGADIRRMRFLRRNLAIFFKVGYYFDRSRFVPQRDARELRFRA